jgi:hypothetical protein
MGVGSGEAVLRGEDQGERVRIERICGRRQFLDSKEVFLSDHYDLQSTDTSSTGGGVVLETVDPQVVVVREEDLLGAEELPPTADPLDPRPFASIFAM